MKLSEASIRAATYPKGQGEWYCKFDYSDVTGIGLEEGVYRRDPSAVIKVGDLFYVWYTKSVGAVNRVEGDTYSKQWPWDYADIFYAVSKNGIDWEERGIAVPRGDIGAYDERTVCTPEILAHGDRYYLVYQCMIQEGEYRGTYETVAIASADNPDGPWLKSSAPILMRPQNGHWFDDYKTYNDVELEGAVHDPTLFYYNNNYYLYYKCGLRMDRDRKNDDFAGTTTRWGVAIADKVEGPYTPSDYNPISNSGHEIIMWKYKGGMAAMINRDGPEKGTIQYAKDGINFHIMSRINHSPAAAGLYRTDKTDEHPLEGLRWGLWHTPPEEKICKWDYIRRFDINKRYLG